MWAVLVVVLVGTVLEAVMDYFEISLDAGALAQTFVTQPQLFGVALVAIEEAGLPLPISGDLLIMYSASRAGRSFSGWILLGLGFEISVLVGSSILYAISRRWGPRLLLGAPGRAVHLTLARIKRVEVWFKRWGWVHGAWFARRPHGGTTTGNAPKQQPRGLGRGGPDRTRLYRGTRRVAATAQDRHVGSET